MSDDEFKLAPTVSKGVEKPKSPRLLSPKISDLNDLRKQRGILKCRLTNFDKFLSKLNVNHNKIQLKLRIDSLVSLFSEFNCIQSKIEKDAEDDDLLSQLDYRETFETQYYSILATAQCILKKNEPELPVNTRSDTCCKPLSIKLPEIKLPAFSGLYNQCGSNIEVRIYL